jgi:hypothetical protein
MFKIGDIVVPKDKTSQFGQFVYMVDEIYLEHMQIVEFNDNDGGLPSLGIYVQQDGWEHKKTYSRRLKIEKINSKINA